jgi:hypothetical protein
MTSSSEGVTCSVQDGAVYVHLDDMCVHIPSHVVNESKVLLDALSSASDSSLTSKFTLAAPIEWLQTWVAWCVCEEVQLGNAEFEVLANCLKVCSSQPPGCSRPDCGILIMSECSNPVKRQNRTFVLPGNCESRSAFHPAPPLRVHWMAAHL